MILFLKKVENKGLEKIQRGITILQDLEYVDGARYYENYLQVSSRIKICNIFQLHRLMKNKWVCRWSDK